MTKDEAIDNAAQMLCLAAKLSTDKDGSPIYVDVQPSRAIEEAKAAVARLIA